MVVYYVIINCRRLHGGHKSIGYSIHHYIYMCVCVEVCVYNNVLLVCDDDRLSINLYKSHITAAAILTCISPRALLLLYFFYIILYIIIYYNHPALCTMPRQHI